MIYTTTNSGHLRTLIIKSIDYNNHVVNINRRSADAIIEQAVDCDILIGNTNYNNIRCCENNNLKCRFEQVRNLVDRYSNS